MVANPATFGFSAEFLGDHPVYDGFDGYLRLDFTKRQPGWEPRFGMATRFDPAVNRYDHLSLLTGSVPGATSEAESEKKGRDLLDELAQGLKSLRPRAERALPKPDHQDLEVVLVAPSTFTAGSFMGCWEAA